MRLARDAASTLPFGIRTPTTCASGEVEGRTVCEGRPDVRAACSRARWDELGPASFASERGRTQASRGLCCFDGPAARTSLRVDARGGKSDAIKVTTLSGRDTPPHPPPPHPPVMLHSQELLERTLRASNHPLTCLISKHIRTDPNSRAELLPRKRQSTWGQGKLPGCASNLWIIIKKEEANNAHSHKKNIACRK